MKFGFTISIVLFIYLFWLKLQFDKSQSKISQWRKFFYSDRAAGNDKMTFKAIAEISVWSLKNCIKHFNL